MQCFALSMNCFLEWIIRLRDEIKLPAFFGWLPAFRFWTKCSEERLLPIFDYILT